MAQEQSQDGAPPEAHRTETVDRYLECIYYIAHEGETVRPSRLADWLGVSAPTVSVNLQRIERDGWVRIARDRSVALPPRGEEVAARIVRRHRLLERWLTDVLALDWATADREAGLLSHGFSDLLLERLNTPPRAPGTRPPR